MNHSISFQFSKNQHNDEDFIPPYFSIIEKQSNNELNIDEELKKPCSMCCKPSFQEFETTEAISDCFLNQLPYQLKYIPASNDPWKKIK